MTYTIDLYGAESRAEIHKRIRKGLPVPEYYGNNLDALHDVLAECANGTEIVFENSTQTAPGMQGYVEALRWMCSETAEEYPEISIEFK
jgi:ribonuclease inhibitor